MYNVTNIRNKLNIAFGKTINNKRKKAGMSQTELGDILKLTKATISKYEKGEIEIPSTILPIISRECNFSMDEYKEAAEEVFIEDSISNTYQLIEGKKSKNEDFYTMSFMTSFNLDENNAQEDIEVAASDLLFDYVKYISKRNDIFKEYINEFINLIAQTFEQDQSDKYKRILNYIYEYQKNDIM